MTTTPQPPPPKKPTQSLSIRASAAALMVPVISYQLTRWLGMDPETALEIAASLFALLASVAAYGFRRAIGGIGILLLALVLSGCTAPGGTHPLAASYARFLEGPGQEWINYADADPELTQGDRQDRHDRWEAARALVRRYEGGEQ